MNLFLYTVDLVFLLKELCLYLFYLSHLENAHLPHREIVYDYLFFSGDVVSLNFWILDSLPNWSQFFLQKV